MTFRLIIPQSNPLDPSGRVSREWQQFFIDLGNAVVGAGSVTTVTATGTTDISLSVANPTTTPALSVALLPTAVTPGAYTNANVTVDAKGRITLAANGASVLPSIANNTLLANTSGILAAPISTTVSALLDSAVGSTQGQVITRNAGVWTVLSPGTAGTFLQSQGAAANLAYAVAPLDFINGRLTGQSGVPVPNTDLTAVATVYFTPYRGQLYTLWDGTSWATVTFTEQSISLAAAFAANTNYDVYAYLNAGALNVETLAWRNSGQAITGYTATATPTITAAAHGLSTGDEVYISGVGGMGGSPNGTYTVTVTGVNTFTVPITTTGTYTTGTGFIQARVGTTKPSIQDGRYCKTGDKTRRFVGGFRTVTATTTQDDYGGVTTNVGGKRFISNYYNRCGRIVAVVDTTTFWVYNVNAWRSANAQAGNKIAYFIAKAEDPVSAVLNAGCSAVSQVARAGLSGIGLNNVGLPDQFITGSFNSAATGIWQMLPQLYVGGGRTDGFQELYWLEKGGDGTNNWLGTNLGCQMGLSATVMN